METNARRGESGTSRGPEAYGERAVDDARDALRERLRAFEARADKNNPEHAAALEAMREQTRALERSRGTWSRRGVPGVERDWSDVRESAKKTVPAPRSYDAYDEYCRYCDVRDGAARGASRLLAHGESAPTSDANAEE